MRLDWLLFRLERRLDEAETHFAALLTKTNGWPDQPAALFEVDGWLSDLWQLWCRFCRNVSFASCQGCTTSAGVVVAQSHATAGAVSYIASNQKKGAPPKAPGTNSLLRLEPTWGHIDKLLDVIKALQPANGANLLSAFGTVPDLEHVRLIRNAAAHRNAQTFADVLAFQSRYVARQIRHPLQALLWTDPGSNRSLIQSRIDDMRVGGRNACA
jgi:hypothetical protein